MNSSGIRFIERMSANEGRYGFSILDSSSDANHRQSKSGASRPASLSAMATVSARWEHLINAAMGSPFIHSRLRTRQLVDFRSEVEKKSK